MLLTLTGGIDTAGVGGSTVGGIIPAIPGVGGASIVKLGVGIGVTLIRGVGVGGAVIVEGVALLRLLSTAL